MAATSRLIAPFCRLMISHCSCRIWSKQIPMTSMSSKCGNANASLLSTDASKRKEEGTEKIYTHHWIEPPDPNSNLRKFVFAKPRSQNSLDVELEEQRAASFAWNNEFWKNHNEKFFQEKKNHARKMGNINDTSEKELSDEMSVFYKDFLDRHYKLHMDYNREWYKRNFGMLLLAFRASLKRMFQRS